MEFLSFFTRKGKGESERGGGRGGMRGNRERRQERSKGIITLKDIIETALE
jgi:hypothetical protein